MDKKCALCGKPLDVFNNSGICEECKNKKFEYNEKLNNFNNVDPKKEKFLNILLIVFIILGIYCPIFLIIGLIIGKIAKNKGMNLKEYGFLKYITIISISFMVLCFILFNRYL